MRKMSERNKLIASLYESGDYTFRELGEKFGISRQRVCQILKSHGYYDYVHPSHMRRSVKTAYKIGEWILNYKLEHGGSDPSWSQILCGLGWATNGGTTNYNNIYYKLAILEGLKVIKVSPGPRFSFPDEQYVASMPSLSEIS